MKLPCVFLFAMLLAAHADAAAPRAGEAEVRAGANGTPCFTVSAREEQRSGTPNFNSVTVADAASGRVAWTMAMPPERTFPVTASMCIPYAGRVQALPQTPAARLEPGRPYRVRIEARRTRGAGPAPRVYEARFCVAQQGEGVTLDAGSRRAGCGGRAG